ncbi:MAG: hypothetical protein ACOYNS_12580 [Bacteroidota bacterium]
MEKAKHSVRFQAEVDENGRVNFSKSVPELQQRAGSKVTVKIFGGVLSTKLTRLDVTEEEIELIGDVQLEDREHVMSFLESQGSLNENKGFRQRMKRMLA